MPKLIDLTGWRFGRLVVLERTANDKWGAHKWLCRCNCENKNEVIVLGKSLKSGHTKSCGCLQKEIVTKHGHKKNGKATEIYQSWLNMKDRCTNPNHKAYRNYGGRGITICEEWMEFPNFERDMIKDWKPGLTLERRKNELGYFKDNCYWGTRTEQARNKRNNHLITAFGKTQCIAAWSEETGIPAQIIQWRMNHGWLPERVLTESVRKYKKYKKRRKNGRS